MSDGTTSAAARFAPLALVALLAIAWLLPAPSGLSLAARDPQIAGRVASALDSLSDGATVVVGFDPDVGTYPEIRAGARALLDDLLARDIQLVMVSLTPEGRALALAEIARLDAGGGAEAPGIIDLGFVPGAEAALVSLSRRAPALDVPEPEGPAADSRDPLTIRLTETGLRAADLIVVVGGNDIGPRTWVEQLQPRIDEIPMLAVAPTILLPELLPFVESGQIEALIGTPGDGAAYREAVGPVEGRTEGVDPLGVLTGLVIAIAALAHAIAAGTMPGLRAGRTEGS